MNRKLNFLLSCLLLALGLLPLHAQDSYTEARARSNANVRVTFKNIPSEDAGAVNGEYPVNSSDGTIAMPYLEAPVRVVGKTGRQIANLLKELYVSQKIYSQPIIEVQVASEAEIQSYQQRYIEVAGFVGAKKNLPYRPGITLSEAILECGDITDYGSRYIQVTRKGQTRTYDYFSQRDRDIELHPKDKIYVKSRGAFERRPDSIGP